MAVRCINDGIFERQRGIIRQNGELQHHLIYLTIAVAAHAEQPLPHLIEQGKHGFRGILARQIIARAMVEQIAQQQQAVCFFFKKTVKQGFCIVCGAVQIRSNHPFHKKFTFPCGYFFANDIISGKRGAVHPLFSACKENADMIQ